MRRAVREVLEEARPEARRRAAALVERGDERAAERLEAVGARRARRRALAAREARGEQDLAAGVLEEPGGRRERPLEEEREHLSREAALVYAGLALERDAERPPRGRDAGRAVLPAAAAAPRGDGVAPEEGQDPVREPGAARDGQVRARAARRGPDGGEQVAHRRELGVDADDVPARDVAVHVRVREVRMERDVRRGRPRARVGDQEARDERPELVLAGRRRACARPAGGAATGGRRAPEPPQHRAERVHVGRGGRAAAAGDLGRDELRGGLGRRGLGVRVRGERGDERPRRELRAVRRVAGEQHDRARIDVAVRDACRVQDLERRQDLARDGLDVPRRARRVPRGGPADERARVRRELDVEHGRGREVARVVAARLVERGDGRPRGGDERPRRGDRRVPRRGEPKVDLAEVRGPRVVVALVERARDEEDARARRAVDRVGRPAPCLVACGELELGERARRRGEPRAAAARAAARRRRARAAVEGAAEVAEELEAPDGVDDDARPPRQLGLLGVRAARGLGDRAAARPPRDGELRLDVGERRRERGDVVSGGGARPARRWRRRCRRAR